MVNARIVSTINSFLSIIQVKLCDKLNRDLPSQADDWWYALVLDNLSNSKQKEIFLNGWNKLSQLDLSMLITIAHENRYLLLNKDNMQFDLKARNCIEPLKKVRNNWAHAPSELPPKDFIINDLNTIKVFFECILETTDYSEQIVNFIEEVKSIDNSFKTIEKKDNSITINQFSQNQRIKEKDLVYLVGNPDAKGMVFSVEQIGGDTKYSVFVDGEIKTFYEGQIELAEDKPQYNWIDIETFQSNLTAYEINNPFTGNLYSLNSARIDFVPYQFRPALKLIKSDEPRILIADSVGVGKTIEAGLIIKELEARSELESILIICPKPLVSERKWEFEMKRFDEDFVPVSGIELRNIISDTDRDGEWPTRYNKSIIPYSILDKSVYEGNDEGKKHSYGLIELDPAPHFDLVIIDEAHHIRNGSLEKEKAFAYKSVRYFCEHADAVVMLTATPLQTSDDDLFTLMNLLRPDLIIDKDTFKLISNPNQYIYQASHLVRSATDKWQEDALDNMKKILGTQWGSNVISKNPVYKKVIDKLQESDLTRDDRVQLLSDIESLHSLNSMLNRTRRKDIQDFCIRRSHTVDIDFTEEQRKLHDAILEFENTTLLLKYNASLLPFLTSTIKRQLTSCVFGLAPLLKDFINKRTSELYSTSGELFDGLENMQSVVELIKNMASNLIKMADNLSPDDPKFDALYEIVESKQNQTNNKIILFSSFRHTLRYLNSKLIEKGIRVGQIDGSVKDDDRLELRRRFELPREETDALDMLLFTEVGSEGLDYQFCDSMINYDLPWNPMRIEQRIGRIDRRGQKSEVVNIYNLITNNTVDADIYFRCLMRIGVFERSIGECEEILGEISEKVEKIAVDSSLSDEERRIKLEQMADNEIRKLQELSNLENDNKALFGFDLSNYTAAKDISKAESPWMSPANLQKLVERYLNDVCGEGEYIIGNSDLKKLRISSENRTLLLNEFRKLSNIKSSLKRKWELYLKGNEPFHDITFYAETASSNRKAFFITNIHPLIKQAAAHFASIKPVNIHAKYITDELPSGIYPFSIYTWNYTGITPSFKVVSVCNNDEVQNDLLDVLLSVESSGEGMEITKNDFDLLETKHIAMWKKELVAYKESISQIANYKLESITTNFKNRESLLLGKIESIPHPSIAKMHKKELENARIKYERKVAEINEKTSNADIHTSAIAHGILEIIN